MFDQSLQYQCECIRFYFMALIQKELDETIRLWNSHYIRKVRNATYPIGRPDVLYHAPNLSGGIQNQISVSNANITIAQSEYQSPTAFGCSEEFLELVSIIMQENSLTVPLNAKEAKHLYLILV